jgi:uncharacterized protein YndB with AHSA1/START domain
MAPPQAFPGSRRTWVTMRITETFVVDASPEVVFDYLTDPSKLADWQTSKTLVEQLTDGPPGLGTLVRERTKPPAGALALTHWEDSCR